MQLVKKSWTVHLGIWNEKHTFLPFQPPTISSPQLTVTAFFCGIFYVEHPLGY